MRHITYSDKSDYPIAILLKDSAFSAPDIERAYILPLEKQGIKREDILVVSLPYNKGKAPVKHIKKHLDAILLSLSDVHTTHIYCADSPYFKVLTNQRKAEPHFGDILPCSVEHFESMKVTLGVNYRSLIYDDKNEPKLRMSLNTLATSVNGTFEKLGNNIVKFEDYPSSYSDIEVWLNKLKTCPTLTCDIETFSLKHHLAGIGTVGFSWNENEGIAFACDYSESIDSNYFGEFVVNEKIRELLLNFFESYEGKLIFHNCPFDIKNLIYSLWMKNLGDTEGLLKGLHCLFKDVEDTKIIAYLSTNSAAGNKLKLKDLAHEFAGNWAVTDIKDIRLIPLPKLLRYNLIDCLSTYFVHNKYYPRMVNDNQEDLYKELMLPSQKSITQIELTGMPLNPIQVAKARKELECIVARNKRILDNSLTITSVNSILQKQAMEAANAKLKTKQHPLSHFADIKLNPGSPKQLQELLYKVMGLPIIDFTDTKQPATGAKTLKKLINHTQNEDHIELIVALMELSKANKILTTFIPAFENAISKGDDGMIWLFGSFNLGGTVSGRLSSSDPNLQNIPSGSTYGKLIKMCFEAPDGWLFSGTDFNSLEDYISALTTRDPNKLKVYTDGFDGHCLRAYSYFKKKLPDIRQASSTDKCFRIQDGSNVYYAKSTDTLSLPDGTKVSVVNYLKTSAA